MRLKKILSAVLAAAMVATFVVAPVNKASAADTKIMYADTADASDYKVSFIGHWIDPATEMPRLIDNRAYMGGSTESLAAYTAGHKAIGNAGDSKGQPGKAYAQIIFTFNVETAGEYTVNFHYASQYKSDSQPRSFAYLINAGEENEWAADLQYHQYEYKNSAKKTDADVVAIIDTLKANGIVGDGGICDVAGAEGNAGWFKIVKQEATITLKAGENKIAICSPSDFDDDSIKGINFYAVDYTLKTAAGGNGNGGTQPGTGVTTVSFVVAGAAMLLGATGIVVSKKKEQ